MPADIECGAWMQEDGPQHECQIQAGHRDDHECRCGETWPHVQPFGTDLLRGAEALEARDRLMAAARPPQSGYRTLEQQQAIYDQRRADGRP